MDPAHSLQLRRHPSAHAVFAAHDAAASGALPLREARLALSELGISLTALECASLARAHGGTTHLPYRALLQSSGLPQPAGPPTPPHRFLGFASASSEEATVVRNTMLPLAPHHQHRSHSTPPRPPPSVIAALLGGGGSSGAAPAGRLPPPPAAPASPAPQPSSLPPPAPSAPPTPPTPAPLPPPPPAAPAAAGTAESSRRMLAQHPALCGALDAAQGLGFFQSQAPPPSPAAPRQLALEPAFVSNGIEASARPGRRRYSATQADESPRTAAAGAAPRPHPLPSAPAVGSAAGSADSATITATATVTATATASAPSAAVTSASAAAEVSAGVLAAVRGALPAEREAAALRLRAAARRADGDGDGALSLAEVAQVLGGVLPRGETLAAREVGMLARWLAGRGSSGSSGGSSGSGGSGSSGSDSVRGPIALDSLVEAVVEEGGWEGAGGGLARVENAGALPPWGSAHSPKGSSSSSSGYAEGHRRRLQGAEERQGATPSKAAAGAAGAARSAGRGRGAGSGAGAGAASQHDAARFEVFMAQWHSKHGAAARRERALDAVEAAGSGATWASASPSPFRVVHLKAPPTPAAAAAAAARGRD